MSAEISVSPHPDPCFGTLTVGERRFLKHWTLDQIRYAMKKYNRINGTDIRIRCVNVAGCEATNVAHGIIMKRME